MHIKQGSDSKIHGLLIFPVVSCNTVQGMNNVTM